MFDVQASPSDPENFPFVVLGNKIDVDGGNSRVVSFFFFSLTCLFLVICDLHFQNLAIWNNMVLSWCLAIHLLLFLLN